MDKLLSDKELFELCKEVFKLEPKWTTNEAIFRLGERIWVSDHESIPVFESNENYKTKYLKKLNIGEEPKEPYEVAPLYTSDYLLEKLPKYLVWQGANTRLEIAPQGYEGKGASLWCAMYVQSRHSIPILETGSTPLKALLKLVIALDEAEQLKGEIWRANIKTSENY